MQTSKFLNNIVLVGVGGSGMSALAGMFHRLGYQNIIGIDAQESEITKKLQKKGINIIIGHGNYDVHYKDFVIYTDIEAVKQSPELQQSFEYEKQRLKRHHKPYTYSEFLAEITKHFITVSITGTNGKSSTTALAIHAAASSVPLMGLGIVGALMPDYQNENFRLNKQHQGDIKTLFDHMIEGILPPIELIKKHLCIIEACEHKEHFLLYDSDYSIVTNIGYDHQDYFPTEQDYRNAFEKFITKTKKATIMPADEAKKRKSGKNVIAAKENKYQFDNVFGDHRQTNASLINPLFNKLEYDGIKVKKQESVDTMQKFHGLWRRMELLTTTTGGAKLYSDYGHHPDAIKKALESLKKEYQNTNIIAIIEPHQAQRLLSLRDDFIHTLRIADQTIVYPIYHARENRENIQKLPQAQQLAIENFEDLSFALSHELGALYMSNIDTLVEKIQSYQKNDVCIFFSAGKLDYQLRNHFAGGE